MSNPIKFSLDIQCYLCNCLFINNNNTYVVYKCNYCKKFTSFCISCELIIKKIFGDSNCFNCFHCNKLSNALDKLEINPNILQIKSIYKSYFKSPSKFLNKYTSFISKNKYKNNNYMISFNNELEKKDNNNNSYISRSNKTKSKYHKEFKLIKTDSYLKKRDLFSISYNRNMPSSFKNVMNKSKSLKSLNINNKTKVQYNERKKIIIKHNSLWKIKNNKNKLFYCKNKLIEKKRANSDSIYESKKYYKFKEEFNFNIKINQTKPKNLIKNNLSRVSIINNNIKDLINRKIELKPSVNNFRRVNCNLKNIFLSYNGSFGFPLFNDINMKSNLFVNQNILNEKKKHNEN